MSTDRDNIIRKIQKCLALSQSPEEGEAAAALRQAQKMMRLHNITEEDVGQATYGSEQFVHSEYEYGGAKPVMISAIVGTICQAFNVRALWESAIVEKNSKSKRVHAVRYFGRKTNVPLAVFSHAVVYRACSSAWRKHTEMTGRQPRGARAAFFAGWCHAVRKKLEDIAPDTKEQEAIDKKVKEHYGTGEFRTARNGTKSIDAGSFFAGAADGKDFSIRRPVGNG